MSERLDAAWKELIATALRRNAVVAVGEHRAAIEAAARAPLDVAPHPGENHEFRTICRRCGEAGFLHVAVITHDEVAVTMTRAEAVARQDRR